MKPDAINIVAIKSKEQALSYTDCGNYGRAFAHFLVALKLVPNWKEELKRNFSTVLCTWGRELEAQGRYKDLFDCYEQAIEIFPENEEVFCNLGAHLFRLGHMREAAHFFRQALDRNNNYLPAYRNLQNVCNSLMERWHFRMLNDCQRNEAYREAILKKIKQGFDCVLDIGTGTGLLSLYAASSGAREVFACDYSPTMCSIAKDVFNTNDMMDRIHLINKLSNCLTVPEDIRERVSLVVTETMDCGLLGEHLLQTVLHAWDQLLRDPCPQPELLAALAAEMSLPTHGVIIPFGASLWTAPIKCLTVARKNHLLHDSLGEWTFRNTWLFSETSEPYDTEHLGTIKDCEFLCDPVNVFEFDFNNPSQIKEYLEGIKDNKYFEFSADKDIDALAVWFDVRLDEDITISSSPHTARSSCCWDQAIFRLKRPKKSVCLRAKCAGGKLVFDISGTSKTPDASHDPLESGVTSEMIRFINNREMQDDLLKSLIHFPNVTNILDLSPFPTLGLSGVQLKSANLVSVLQMANDMTAVSGFVINNNLNLNIIKCLVKSEVEDVLKNKKEYDLIVNNVFELTGELREENINLIPKLMKSLAPGGILAPTNLTVMCQLVDCAWARQTSGVVDEELIQLYKIADLINVYQVLQQLDVDLRNTEFTALSAVTECLHLTQPDLATDRCMTAELTLTATQDGCVTAVPMWYQCQLCPGAPWVSTYSENSHINQVMFLVEPPLVVKAGETVRLHVTFHCGILRIKVLS